MILNSLGRPGFFNLPGAVDRGNFAFSALRFAVAVLTPGDMANSARIRSLSA
jgi:hypothetical protein